MNCIKLHPSLLIPLSYNSQLRYQQQLQRQTTKLLWFTNNVPNTKLPSSSSLRTKAFPDSIALAAASQTQSGDITVFLRTSGLLLFVYWISNFVVPDLISKYFQYDKVGEEQKKTDDASGEQDKNTSKMSQGSSVAKKRGFGGSKI